MAHLGRVGCSTMESFKISHGGAEGKSWQDLAASTTPSHPSTRSESCSIEMRPSGVSSILYAANAALHRQ